LRCWGTLGCLPKVSKIYQKNAKNVTKMGAQWDKKGVFFEKRVQKRKSRPKKGVGSDRPPLFHVFFQKNVPPWAPEGSPNRLKIDKSHVKNRFFCGWAPGTTFSSICDEKRYQKSMKNKDVF